MKYTLKEIAAVCRGQLFGKDIEVDSVMTDSRSFIQTDTPLFVAIAGKNHDGHAYINKLYHLGVRAFLIERDIKTDNYPEAGFVLVNDSIVALQKLAAHYRGTFEGTVVAITGSNGKTIVKEWAAALVPDEVKLFRSPKSYNSQIGVPLSILMMRGDEQIALIEAGISRPGEMEVLEKIIRPDIGLITNVGDAHQENFAHRRDKIKEKLKLFAGCRLVIYNGIDKELGEALKALEVNSFLLDYSQPDEVYGMFGDQAARENAAAAVTLCDVLGMEHSHTIGRLPFLGQMAMRLELLDGIYGSIILNDSYNADINSLKIAIDKLRSVASGRKMSLILSEVKQCGHPDEELYTYIADMVSRAGVDRVICIGQKLKEYSGTFPPGSRFYDTAAELLNNLKADDIRDRAVLIKGNSTSGLAGVSHAMASKSHTTILEVNLDKLIANLNLHRGLISRETRIMVMVKADAYGNGAYEIASQMQHEGIDYLAVAFADEGVELRNRGITIPIVVLNADEDSFDAMVSNSLQPEIYNLNSLRSFSRVLRRYGERRYPVHIKIDTGMHRLGFTGPEIDELIAILKQNSELITVGSIFSHFAAADEPEHDSFTKAQLAAIMEVGSKLTASLGYRPLMHIANTAGIQRFPEAELDMVRIGIGLYGFGTDRYETHEISSLKTRIAQIKHLSDGDTVGYGRQGTVGSDMKIAIIPVGYADGIDRRLGNGNWTMIVNGHPARTMGRISMDTCAIDITGIDAVGEGDEVTIFDSRYGWGVGKMAEVLDTIPYEIMTSVSRRVKRIYIKE